MGMLASAYVDETNMGLDGPVFAMGGYLASATMWEAFSDDWQDELDIEPALPPLHMSGFHMEPPCEERHRLCRLASLTCRKGIYPFLAAIRVSDWRSVVLPHICKCNRRLHGHPYPLLCYTITYMMLNLQDHVAADFGRVDMFFDWQQNLGLKVKASIEDTLPRFLERNSPHLRQRLGDVNWPRDRQVYVPLQAADMLLWHYQRIEKKLMSARHSVWAQLTDLTNPQSVQNMDGLLSRHVSFVKGLPCRCKARRPRPTQ